MNIHDIVKQFNTTPFLFAGSGITRRYYGLPNWEGLLTYFAQKVRNDELSFQYYENSVVFADEASKMPAIASLIEKDYNAKWFMDEEGIRSHDQAVLEAVKNHISPFKAEIAAYIRRASQENPEYSLELEKLRKISERNLSGIITTNYDCLFESIFEGYKVFVGQDELVFSQLQGVAEIYKVHGSITDPSTIVINQDDYTVFRSKSKYLAAKLMTIFMEYPIIFLGYSISDPDIQSILSDIVVCMPDSKLQLLKNRFIFVEYSRAAMDLAISGYSVNVNGKVLEMTKIVLSDFGLLFDALLRKKAAIPVKVLRRFKDELYSFALTSEPGPSMKVAHIEDSRIDENTLALTIGLSETGMYGLKRAVDAAHWYRNVVLQDSPYSADDLLQAVYPDLLKMNSSTLPVWFYLGKAKTKSEMAIDRAPKSYADIVNEQAIKRNQTAAAGRDLAQIWETEQNNLGRALRIMGSLPEHKVNAAELERIIRMILEDNKDALNSFPISDRSNLKRLIRIYDYIAYSPKHPKTP